MKDAPATKKDIQKLESQIQKLDGKVDANTQRLEGKIGGLEGRTDGLEARFVKVESRLEKVEGRLGSLDAKLDGFINRSSIETVRTHERMDKIETGLRQEMRQLNSQILGALDGWAVKFETIWRESAIIPGALDKHGAMLRDHESRIGRLESPGRP